MGTRGATTCVTLHKRLKTEMIGGDGKGQRLALVTRVVYAPFSRTSPTPADRQDAQLGLVDRFFGKRRKCNEPSQLSMVWSRPTCLLNREAPYAKRI